MSGLLSLLTAIPGLMNAFGGGTTMPYQRQQEQIAGRQNQISQALTDTNNPLYQQLYGQYKAQNQANMADTISQLQGQNRMNASMGRVPLFNQERGGENIFRALMQQSQNGGVQADQQTRNYLMGGLQGGASALGGYNAITPYAKQANASQLSGYQGIYDLLNSKQQNPGSQGGGMYPTQAASDAANNNPNNPNRIMWNNYSY